MGRDNMDIVWRRLAKYRKAKWLTNRKWIAAQIKTKYTDHESL